MLCCVGAKVPQPGGGLDDVDVASVSNDQIEAASEPDSAAVIAGGAHCGLMCGCYEQYMHTRIECPVLVA